MKNRCLIWLNWAERPFRLNAADLKLVESLFRGDVKAVRSERAFLKELPSATHVLCWEFRREWFARAPELRVLATPSAGRELLPTEAELPKGVKKYHGAFHGAIMSETPMELMSGFIGALEDEKANMLIPQIGWLVRVKGETTK